MTKRLTFWLAIAVFLLLFIFAIRAVLLPFVLGILTAYFLDPAADRLEKCKLSRGMATLVITTCFFLTIALLSFLIVPVIAGQLSGLIVSLPDYVASIEQDYHPLLVKWWGEASLQPMEQLRAIAGNVSGMVFGTGGDVITGIFHSGMALLTLLSLILITPVVTFYMLRDWDVLVARLDALLPRPHASVIRKQLALIDRALAGFLRGQLNVCLMLAAYYAVGLSIVGLKFGIVIGILTGFLVIIPYIGAAFGMALGLGVAYFQLESLHYVGLVLVVFVTGQLLEGGFITPRLVGNKVGLHPVWIIFGLLAGGALFGFVGILIAVPVTAVIGVLIRFALERYLESDYYQGEKSAVRKR